MNFYFYSFTPQLISNSAGAHHSSSPMTCQVERDCCLPISIARGMNGKERNDSQLQYQKSCCSCSTTSQATTSTLGSKKMRREWRERKPSGKQIRTEGGSGNRS
eukprot:scaffold15581_cov85-Skeletonema_dohrnii-CCMP3373.AAC.5